MKPTQIWLLIAILVSMTLVVTLNATKITTAPSIIDSYQLHGNFINRRSMAGNYNQRMAVGATCDKVPRVCVARGSTGPDCCNKKCVDTWSDRNNCGRCGKKCKYSETCCDGNCVNLRFDEYHCGRCNNRCNTRKSSNKKNYKPSSCSYGMCNYA